MNVILSRTNVISMHDCPQVCIILFYVDTQGLSAGAHGHDNLRHDIFHDNLRHDILSTTLTS